MKLHSQDETLWLFSYVGGDTLFKQAKTLPISQTVRKYYWQDFTISDWLILNSTISRFTWITVEDSVPVSKCTVWNKKLIYGQGGKAIVNVSNYYCLFLCGFVMTRTVFVSVLVDGRRMAVTWEMQVIGQRHLSHDEVLKCQNWMCVLWHSWAGYQFYRPVVMPWSVEIRPLRYTSGHYLWSRLCETFLLLVK